MYLTSHLLKYGCRKNYIASDLITQFLPPIALLNRFFQHKLGNTTANEEFYTHNTI
jgi:hypothetical protein